MLMLSSCSQPPETPPAPAGSAPAVPPDPGTLRKGPRVYVTNERSGNLTVIDARTNVAIATIHLGKRPRGIKLAPDGTTLYVALSGSPIAPPGVDESTLPPPAIGRFFTRRLARLRDLRDRQCD
jgi:YVTN family beta-propeller protein